MDHASKFGREEPRTVGESPDVGGDFRGSFSGYERDCLFYNPDGAEPGLVQAGYVLGVDDDHDGRAAVPVDVDGDGDLDLVQIAAQGLTLLENTAPPSSFARVRLKATSGPAEAIGAVVTLHADGRRQRDHVTLTEGFQAQVPLDLHFGLGDADAVDSLTVRWPSGREETWTDLPARRLILVTEGEPEVTSRPLPRWPEASRPSPPPAASPQLTAERLDGGRGPLGTPGRPTVVNFWAPWCAPCHAELPQLARLARSLSEPVDIVGVSVETDDLAAVRASIERFGLPYPQALADEALLSSFFGRDAAVALPSTFVFDGGGRLRRVFRRGLTAPELSGLLASFRDEALFAADVALLAARAERAGRWSEALEHHDTLSRLDPTNARHPYNRAVVRLTIGDAAGAARDLEVALSLDADHAAAWYRLGVLQLTAGRAGEAVRAFRRTRELLGDTYDVLLRLGIAAADAGQQDEVALDALQAAVAADGERVEAHLVLGRLHARRGDGPAARAAFTEALRRDPESRVARDGLAALEASEP